MAVCRDCGDFVVFLKREDGSYMPPVVPVGLDPEGDKLFVADAEGVGRPPPQLYKPHQCLSPDQKAALQRQRAEEKQRLIEADRERRRIARETEEALEAERERLAAEQAELDAIRQAQLEEEEREKEERRLRKAYDKDAELATKRFPQHLLTVPCRDCGQDPGWACWQLNSDGTLYDPAAFARGKYRVEHGWFTDRPHNARYQDGPPNPVRPVKTPRWGREYKGPWPPARNDPGRYDMRSWLTENYTIFSTDDRPDGGDWVWRLTSRERAQMGRFVKASASILWDDMEEVPDGTGGVVEDLRGGRREGLLRDRGADGPGPDAREVEEAGDPVRADGSGRALEGDREHEDRA